MAKGIEDSDEDIVLSDEEGEECIIEWKGEYVDVSLEPTEKINKLNYGYIDGSTKSPGGSKSPGGYKEPCIYFKKRNAEDTLPIIIDLIKPIFGLESVGVCHNTKYIIYKPYIVDGKWKVDEPLSVFKEKLTYGLVRQKRKILAFRYLLGLPGINDTNILVRHGRLLDYNDRNNKIDTDNEKIAMKVINDNFQEQTLWETLKLMTERKGVYKIEDTISIIRKEVRKVVKKIDRSKVSFVSSLTERLEELLDNNNK
jgi:hypothetical protein